MLVDMMRDKEGTNYRDIKLLATWPMVKLFIKPRGQAHNRRKVSVNHSQLHQNTKAQLELNFKQIFLNIAKCLMGT